jgi:hypothetical protein
MVICFVRKKRNREGCLVFESPVWDKESAKHQFRGIAGKTGLKSKDGWCWELGSLFLICVKGADCSHCDLYLHNTIPLPTSEFFMRRGLTHMLSYLKNHNGANEGELRKRFDHVSDKLLYLEVHGSVRRTRKRGENVYPDARTEDRDVMVLQTATSVDQDAREVSD